MRQTNTMQQQSDSHPLPARTAVLIVGAGPVGQSLAIELGSRGIECLVVERNSRIGITPRAKATNVRSREHLRRWGIADKLREASPLGPDYPSHIVFATRMNGHLLARFDNALYCAPGRHPLFAEHAQWVPQYTVERVMREHIATLPSVRVVLDHELVEFSQNTAGVKATIRDIRSDAIHTVQADYIVGCDGARSRVRELIAAKLQGEFGISRHFNLIFRAPGLAQSHPHGPAIQYWQINEDAPSTLGPLDRDDLWYFGWGVSASAARPTASAAAALIRRATRVDLPYEVLNIDEWLAHRVVADRYRDRRAFLAGDACHLHPPYGGFGMNMGISDAVDLGWKMAAVLEGWGGPALLDSYERERRPVHLHVLQQAISNHATLTHNLVEPQLEASSAEGAAARARVRQRIWSKKLSEFYTLGTILGDCYDESPVIADGRSGREAPRDFLNYVPSSAPGHRAPHAWLHDGSSLYDHFGPGLTLLVLARARPECVQRAQAQAAQLAIPLTILRTDNPGVRQWYAHALTLIRVDHHIAWAGDEWQASSGLTVLEKATGRFESSTAHTQQLHEALHDPGV